MTTKISFYLIATFFKPTRKILLLKSFGLLELVIKFLRNI